MNGRRNNDGGLETTGELLFGYDALHSGLVMSPSGLSSIGAMLVAGVLLSRGTDARWLIAAGLAVAATGNFWMSRMNLEIGPWQAAWPRMVLTAGMGLMFAPINVAAFKYTPLHLRRAAVGMLALLRNEGGSVGTSLAQTMKVCRDQLHTLRVGEFLDPFNPAVTAFLRQSRQFFLEETGDPAASQQMALQPLADLRAQQSLSMDYFDIFWMTAVLGALLVFLVVLIKPSAAEKGRACDCRVIPHTE